MFKFYPLLKVYYDEAGNLIFVYAPLWAIGFCKGTDLNALEAIADDSAPTPE